MRIVLDTNVLLGSLPKSSLLRPVFDAIWQRRVELVVSTPILLEYEEILAVKTSPLVAHNVLELLLGPAQARLQPTWFDFGLPTADPDDQKFVDAYLAGAADYLVSDDGHFRALAAAGFPPVRVVGAAGFVLSLTTSQT